MDFALVISKTHAADALMCIIFWSSLVNTLPKTKKDKYTAVTEAHKECTRAANALANSLQKAN